MKKKLLIALISLPLLLILILVIGQYFALNYAVDRINHKLKYSLQHKYPYMSLRLEEKERHFFKRNFQITLSVDKKIKDVERLYLVFDSDLQIGLSKIYGQIKLNHEASNLQELEQSFKLSRLAINGDYQFEYFKLKLSSNLNSHDFVVPLPQAYCAMGPSRLHAHSKGFAALELELSLSKLACNTYAQYQGRDHLAFEVKDFFINLSPYLTEANKLNLDSVDLSLYSLNAKLEPLGLLGFDDGDNVLDPSLTDRIKLDHIQLQLSSSDKDKIGFATLNTSFAGNINYAIPYIKKGQLQDFTRLHEIKGEVSISRINLSEIYKLLKSHHLQQDLFKAISPQLVLLFKELRLKHNNQYIEHSGKMELSLLDQGKLRLHKVKGDFDFVIDKILVNDFAQDYGYSKDLADLLAKHALDDDGLHYQGRLQIRDSMIKLNGISL